jgi:hypothetical protein
VTDFVVGQRLAAGTFAKRAVQVKDMVRGLYAQAWHPHIVNEVKQRSGRAELGQIAELVCIVEVPYQIGPTSSPYEPTCLLTHQKIEDRTRAELQRVREERLVPQDRYPRHGRSLDFDAPCRAEL